jgi:hypothetical protein
MVHDFHDHSGLRRASAASSTSCADGDRVEQHRCNVEAIV